MRSAYLRFQIKGIDNDAFLSEPAGTAWIRRLVIKCNGSVVEDINHFGHLSAFFKRKVMTREMKNAHSEECWHVVNKCPITRSAQDHTLDGAASGAYTIGGGFLTSAPIQDLSLIHI